MARCTIISSLAFIFACTLAACGGGTPILEQYSALGVLEVGKMPKERVIDRKTGEKESGIQQVLEGLAGQEAMIKAMTELNLFEESLEAIQPANEEERQGYIAMFADQMRGQIQIKWVNEPELPARIELNAPETFRAEVADIINKLMANFVAAHSADLNASVVQEATAEELDN